MDMDKAKTSSTQLVLRVAKQIFQTVGKGSRQPVYSFTTSNLSYSVCGRAHGRAHGPLTDHQGILWHLFCLLISSGNAGDRV